MQGIGRAVTFGDGRQDGCSRAGGRIRDCCWSVRVGGKRTQEPDRSWPEAGQPPLVEIVWHDSYSLDDEWFPVPHEPKIRVITSSGYEVASDATYVTLASTFDLETRHFSNGIAILQCCVLSRRVI